MCCIKIYKSNIGSFDYRILVQICDDNDIIIDHWHSNIYPYSYNINVLIIIYYTYYSQPVVRDRRLVSTSIALIIIIN